MKDKGNLRKLVTGKDYKYYEKKFIGFDENNNLVWGEQELIATVPRSIITNINEYKYMQSKHADGDISITSNGVFIQNAK